MKGDRGRRKEGGITLSPTGRRGRADWLTLYSTDMTRVGDGREGRRRMAGRDGIGCDDA